MNLKKLFKLSVDLICTVDAQNLFVEVSDASTTILGYTPAEMCGRSFKEFLIIEDLPLAETIVDMITTARPDAQIQLRYRHKDGSIVALLWSVQWDDEDKLIYCIGRYGQITEQTESMRISLEESNRRYEYVTKATSDAIWDWDLETGELYRGEGFATIFGYHLPQRQDGFNSWTQYIHPEDVNHIVGAIYATLHTMETNWKEEYRYLRADGTYADVVDRGLVIRNQEGVAVRMVGAMHDISERRKSLLEMKRVTADLFKRNRELHEFGYIVSHNLRSPVANIKGIAMLMEIESGIPEKLRAYISNIHSSVSRLDDVIIDLSKILSSQDSTTDLKYEKLDLLDIIGKIRADLSEKIVQSDTQINVSGGPFIIRSHKAYIYSIFLNLISNSIKYKFEIPAIINIAISQSRDGILISYQDNGTGIDLKRHGEEIFKPYKRFHSTIDGKGLGLFLVRSHIESMSGTISVKSKPNKGVCFTITLPASAV